MSPPRLKIIVDRKEASNQLPATLSFIREVQDAVAEIGVNKFFNQEDPMEIIRHDNLTFVEGTGIGRRFGFAHPKIIAIVKPGVWALMAPSSQVGMNSLLWLKTMCEDARLSNFADELVPIYKVAQVSSIWEA